jgi:hypothetical protein
MSTPSIHEDVFDPTADPRHKPPAELPGENPTVPRPRDVDPDAPPPPDEPVVVRPGQSATTKPADQPG